MKNQTTFWALKTSAAVGTILAPEHLWKKKNNKKAAIAVLVASNAVPQRWPCATPACCQR